METIKIKFQNGDSCIPVKATKGSAAYDIRVTEDIIIYNGRNIVPTGIAIEMPIGLEAKIEPRSGFSAKGMEGYSYIVDGEGHIVANINAERFDADVIVGKIDSDYRNYLGVIVKNNDTSFLIRKGTRIAQLTFYKVEEAEWIVVSELSKTDRDKGGFGSTGTK